MDNEATHKPKPATRKDGYKLTDEQSITVAVEQSLAVAPNLETALKHWYGLADKYEKNGEELALNLTLGVLDELNARR